MEQAKQIPLLTCAKHSRCPYQFLWLKKENCNNRLLCAECIVPKDGGNKKNVYSDLIPLSIALNQPEAFTKWMKKDFNFNYFKKIEDFCGNDIENQITEQIKKFDLLAQVLKKIKEELQLQLQGYKSLKEELQKYRESFLEKIKYNEFQQLIKQLKELEVNSQNYKNVNTQISTTIEAMYKNNCELLSKSMENINNQRKNLMIKLKKPSFELYYSQITDLFKNYENLIFKMAENLRESIRCFELPQFKLLSNYYFTSLEQKIEKDTNKQIKSMNLIYSGNGITNSVFWGKVDGKRNLLMVFQSKNSKYVFGGFSQCQWSKDSSGMYVQDATLTSFLFSQTNNEIYPLKDKANAIYCKTDSGPVFGNGNDLNIESDFQKGYSKLGASYTWDQYQNKNSDHLFGEAAPNIGDCEIYEITLA